MENKKYWPHGMTIEELERHAILEALEHFSGNRTHASEELGICARTMRNKLAIYRSQGFKIPGDPVLSVVPQEGGQLAAG